MPRVLPKRRKEVPQKMKKSSASLKTHRHLAIAPGFCFPIERDLKLPNFVRGYYPGCPGHPRVLRFASSHCVSVPPWLLAPFEIMQINATMRDSDFSGDALRLTGAASLCALLGLPIPRVLPVYPDLTSTRAVHADPAGALNRLRLFSCLLPTAFTPRIGARLVSGYGCFEAHLMWFTFVTARLFHSLSFQPRLAATLLSSCSVANSPIRRVGLSPTLRPASLEQALLAPEARSAGH